MGAETTDKTVNTPDAPPAKDDQKDSQFAAGIKRGEERFAKKLEKELGVPFNVEEIKSALDFRAKAADAAKTVEQKAAEAKMQFEASSKENERLRGILAVQAEAKMKSLKSQELRDMVVAAVGEDPLAQIEFMGKSQFSALEAKLGGAGASLAGVAANGDDTARGADQLKIGKDLYAKALAGDRRAEQMFSAWHSRNNSFTLQQIEQ